MYLANPKKAASTNIIGGHRGPPAEKASTHTSRHNETEDDRTFAAMYKEFFNNTDIDFSNFTDGGKSKL